MFPFPPKGESAARTLPFARRAAPPSGPGDGRCRSDGRGWSAWDRGQRHSRPRAPSSRGCLLGAAPGDSLRSYRTTTHARREIGGTSSGPRWETRARRAFDPSAGVRQPGNDYSGAVQRCLSADQPVRRMNRASPDWGKRIGFRDRARTWRSLMLSRATRTTASMVSATFAWTTAVIESRGCHDAAGFRPTGVID